MRSMPKCYYVVTKVSRYEDRMRWTAAGLVKPPGGRLFVSRLNAELIAKNWSHMADGDQPAVELTLEIVEFAVEASVKITKSASS